MIIQPKSSSATGLYSSLVDYSSHGNCNDKSRLLPHGKNSQHIHDTQSIVKSATYKIFRLFEKFAIYC